MACYRPLQAYRAPGGGVAFDSAKGYVDLPLDLPCGKCPGCLEARAVDWTVRNYHELLCHDKASYLTLTYRDEDLPPNESLSVEDWQRFAKRLRKRVGPFRYYMCGEYGDKLGRPHMHCILYGVDFAEDRVPWMPRNGYQSYRSPTLEKAWKFGHSELADVNRQAIAYVARYVTKKQVSKEDKANGVRPEFNLMSRKPGIGARWLERFRSDVYPADECVIEGRRYRPPRFYDQVLSESELESLRLERASKVKRSDSSPDRLKVREECHIGKNNLFSRK